MKKLTDKTMLGITLLVMFVFVLSIYLLLKPKVPQQTQVLDTKPQSTIVFPRTNTTVFVEVADTNDKIQLGLSYRDHMNEDVGMLFDLGYEDTYPSFWMKGMHFPLDFIWINDNKVVDIHTDVPNMPLDTPDSQLQLYRPTKPVDMILEVNAGFVSKHDIQVGDSIEITLD